MAKIAQTSCESAAVPLREVSLRLTQVFVIT